MGLKITNNAFGTLAASINDSVTSITVASGQGSRFPTLGAGDYFYATLINISNEFEIVKCTARTGDVLTVTRAQDGTTARAYTVGDRLEIRPVAAIFDEKADVGADVNVSQITGTLPPSKGGTGITSPGTSGNVLTSNGTDWVSQAPAAPPAGGFSNMQVFESSGTFTVPAGITKVKVTVVGGGGNGATGGGSLSSGGGGGGGGGGAIEVVTGLTPGGTVSVTVGGAGGTSSFGAFCSATGGGNGSGGSPGDGGLGSGGQLNIGGSRGGFPTASAGSAANYAQGGAGGNSFLGGGGGNANVSATGNAGKAYGGGGAGGSTSGLAGGAGAAGVVIVEY
jgi:hypothetical protein